MKLFPGIKTFEASAPTNSKGFTLAEIMIALAIGIVVISTVLKMFASLSQNYTVQNVAADVQQTGRGGLHYMTNNIRIAGLDPFQMADAGIVAATADSLRFTLDRCDLPIGGTACGSPDGEIDDKSEDITYQYNPGTGEIVECKPDALGVFHCDVLLEKVAAFKFVYVLEDDSTTSTPANTADIRSVMITLSIQEPAGRSDPVRRSFSTRVRCRNIGI
jgi:prepilin-type N-terminal cleavage/methylation domain-containing protein